MVAFAVVLLVSWFSREGHEQRFPIPARGTWGTNDLDTYYHLRRVDRALTEGVPPAGEDSRLDYPAGAAIPWPPYYTWVAWSVTAPFAPDAKEARRDFVERRVASLPAWFGVATSGVVAAAGGMLAGPFGALIAGGNHALSLGPIFYSVPGNGDHHAWVALLLASMTLLASAGIGRGALTGPGRGLRWGAAAGAVAGIGLGSWVGFLLHLAPLQLALVLLAARHLRRPLPGVPALGAAFHGAALVAVLPAIVASPWNARAPWSVVNLTWFHAAWLGAGLVLFGAFAAWRAPGVSARVRVAVLVAAALGVAVFLAQNGAALLAGVREGFAWMQREDTFMGTVWESRPVGLHEAGILSGRAYYLLPALAIAAAWFVARRGRFVLLPWLCAVAILAIEAAQQYRFHETLAIPFSVLLGWGVAVGARAASGRWPGLAAIPAPRRSLVAAAAVVVAMPLLHRQSVAESVAGWKADAVEQHALVAVVRDLCEWIRRATPPGEYAVLADWSYGHAIEWVADRASVGTNFGIFLGEASFLDAGRFFLAEDPAEAQRILQDRRARYVMVTPWDTKFVSRTAQGVDPALVARYTEPGSGGDVRLRFEWFKTMGARLLFDGSVIDSTGNVGAPLDFLRVVTVAPARYPELMMGMERPAGWVWEHVPGAVVEAHGRPGDSFLLEMRIRYERADYEIVWGGRSVADATGTARLRVPYATDRPNGEGLSRGPARWSLGATMGTLEVPERAVLAGDVLTAGPER